MSAGLSARLNGRRGALDLDVAFAAAPGSITALSGPSGAGKTTILRALAGLERLEGEVSVGGEVWQDRRRFLRPHDRGVGYVFQQGALFPHLSVQGNLDYARKRSGADAGEAAALIDSLRLGPLLRRSPERLSGGERARVALARALLTRPSLVLLDEPLSGLDAATRDALLPPLKATLRGLAAPVLLVSHDAAEVAALADRSLDLRQGRLIPPQEAGRSPLAGRSQDDILRLAHLALAAGLDHVEEPDGEA